MTTFTLHGFWESGNAYKVALMLELNKADWQCQHVAFFTGATRREAFRELNVMGEVPVMVHHRADSDFTLSQSGACLTYLSRYFGTYGPEGEREEYDVMRWLLFDSQKVSGFTGPLRFLRSFAGGGFETEAKWLEGRTYSALKAMDAALADTGWLVGGRCTIADLACQGYLHWPDEIGITYDKLPNISAWLEGIRALPGFKDSKDLMPSGQEPKTAIA